MDEVEIIRFLHIMSAIFLFGAGMGTAFHGFAAHFGGGVETLAVTNRNVVLADWIFTTPTVILQPLTGGLLMYELGWSLQESWLALSVGLYVLAGACWLPVVWLQLRMQAMARQARDQADALPALYHRYHRIWFALGCPAFLAMITVMWLMITKPDF